MGLFKWESHIVSGDGGSDRRAHSEAEMTSECSACSNFTTGVLRVHQVMSVDMATLAGGDGGGRVAFLDGGCFCSLRFTKANDAIHAMPCSPREDWKCRSSRSLHTQPLPN